MSSVILLGWGQIDGTFFDIPEMCPPVGQPYFPGQPPRGSLTRPTGRSLSYGMRKQTFLTHAWGPGKACAGIRLVIRKCVWQRDVRSVTEVTARGFLNVVLASLELC